jgi:carboxymethylenebutenolidase
MGMDVNFEIAGHAACGYLALPSAPGPAVIVIQEWWGLVGHIKSIVDRYAQNGFVAFAPDLYHGQAASEPDEARKLMMELKLDSAVQELRAAAKYLISLPEFDRAKSFSVNVVGFCMGGTLAIWSATQVPEIGKAAAFYPGASWERHNPDWRKFAGKSAIFNCSEGDGTSAAPGIQEALREINGAGGGAVAYDYPATQHAFFNSDRPEVYNQAAAELAWERTLEFFTA